MSNDLDTGNVEGAYAELKRLRAQFAAGNAERDRLQNIIVRWSLRGGELETQRDAARARAARLRETLETAIRWLEDCERHGYVVDGTGLARTLRAALATETGEEG